MLPGLLLLTFTGSLAQSREIVEFSIYDEFGDIMFNGPGELVLNGRRGSFRFEDDIELGKNLDNYRYRLDTYESAYRQGQEALTTYRKNHLQQKVWKFRPLEDKKDKKIIKIEDPPSAPYQGGYMMPPMSPMVPMMPGLQPGLTTPGWMYPGTTTPGLMYPFYPFRF